MANSIAARVVEWASEIEALLPALATGQLEDINANSHGLVIITGTPFSWSPLSTEGHRVQSQVLEAFRHFAELVRVLTREQPQELRREVEADITRVTRFIERDSASHGTPERVLRDAVAELTRLAAQIEKVFSARFGAVIVPDTNALYWNPALEEWRHPDGSAFSIVLTPLVLSELDAHKDDPRNSSRQKKANRLARQFGEYRRRGRLSDGVPLVSGVSTVASIATEPRVADSLPWLDASSPDDRFLTSALEVMRQNTRADVLVVTRDLNLQNKLDFAHLPSAHPDEFVREATQSTEGM